MKTTTIITIIWFNVKIWINRLTGNRFNLLPYKVLISLTDKCNSRCNFCDIWKVDDFSNEITLEDTIKLFDSMGPNLVWLALSGGEVTLVKYVDSMLAEAKKRCKNLKLISFTTNGLLPEKAIRLSKKIMENGFDLMVTVSLDGDKDSHDRVRGVPGNYDKCTALYADLKKIGINVNYGITVSNENNSYIHKEYNKMKHSIKAITFVHEGGIFKKTNRQDSNIMLDSLKHIYNEYSIDTLSEIIEYIHIKVAMCFLTLDKKSNLIPCEVLNTSIHIMPDGAVHPCMYLEKVGNIRDGKIIDMVFSEISLNIKKKIKNDNCPHCWMNCYSPYSLMLHPFKSLSFLFKRHA